MLATTAQKLTLAAATLALCFSILAAIFGWLAVGQAARADDRLYDIDWKASLAHEKSEEAVGAAKEAAENGRLAYEAALDCGR